MAESPITFSTAEVSGYYAARIPKLKQARGGPTPGALSLFTEEPDDNFAIKPETREWFCHSVCGRGGSLVDFAGNGSCPARISKGRRRKSSG